MENLNCILSSLNLSCPLLLKAQSISVLEYLVDKNNVIGVLPTGYGKSLIYTLYPLLLDQVIQPGLLIPMEKERLMSKTLVLTGYGGYDKLQVELRPVPTPTSGNVIINVMASGVNFAELMCRQGTYDRTPNVPAVLGMEAAGVVVNTASDVDKLEKGQRVVCLKDLGLWAEFVEVPARNCFVLPESMSFEHAAALLMNYVTAYQMLFDFGNLRAGCSVLVHMAAGGVGMAATQLCHTVPDVTVFGTASASKHDLIRQNGVTHAIDYRTKDYAQEVRAISPKGVDIVLDPLNGADAAKGYQLLKRLGKIIHYGAANAVSGPNRSLWSLASTYLSVRNYSPLFMLGDNKAACGYHLGHMLDEPDEYKEVVFKLFKLYEAGKIKPVIDSVWSFEHVANAMSRMHNRENVGKVLITPSDTSQQVHSEV